MRKKKAGWTLVLIFVCGALFLSSSYVASNEIVSLKIKDTFPGDTPDGFPSPGEKVALSITLMMDFIPEESHIICDTALVSILNHNTKFFRKNADILINSPFEPTLLIKQSCPTDTLIPFMLVYRKDTILDSLSFYIHTIGTVDSCFLDKKVNKTNSKLHIKVDTRATDGCLSGYSGIFAEISDSEGEVIDTVELFDDGKHQDVEEGDGLFANSWWSPTSFKDYTIDLILEDSFINYSYEIERTTGFTTKSFSHTHPFLIIGDPYSDGPENKAVDAIEELMDSLNLEYDNWDIWFRGYPDSNEISLWGMRKAVMIWATRLGGTIKYSTKGKHLIEDFLRKGGNLFLATSYLGSYTKAYGNEVDSVFYEDILCSRFVKRLSSGDPIHTLSFFNPSTELITDSFNLSLPLPDSNGFVSFTEIIEPIQPALPIISLQEMGDSTMSIDSTYYFGLNVKKDDYRVIYFSFNISEISPLSARIDLLRESLNWLSEETAETFSSQPPSKKEITLVRLSDPYPNPFLTESTIPFSLLSASEVNLTLIDLSGRTVRYLLRSSLNEGNYYVVWDGKDEHGDETAVGYYFIRLSARTKDKLSGEEIEIVVSKKLLKLRK